VERLEKFVLSHKTDDMCCFRIQDVN